MAKPTTSFKKRIMQGVPRKDLQERRRRNGSNRWATMSRAGAAKRKDKPKGKRRALDDYETPESATLALAPFLFIRRGTITEPTAGTGRMVRALRKMYRGVKVVGTDIKTGQDFLKRTAVIKGHCVANPPYRDGQAEAFARHGLKLTDGKVAMLMQSGFVWGSRRANGLYLAGYRPELIVVIPWRVMFVDGDGKTIEGQFFSHCWVVWPERSKRAGNASTRIEWAEPPAEES